MISFDPSTVREILLLSGHSHVVELGTLTIGSATLADGFTSQVAQWKDGTSMVTVLVAAIAGFRSGDNTIQIWAA